MMKKMRGGMSQWTYPVLKTGSEIALTNKEKAEIIVNTFVVVHRSNNLTGEGKRGRGKTKAGKKEALRRKNELDIPFTNAELMRALAKTGMSAPGKHRICYIMVKHVRERGLTKLLMLFIKVWKERPELEGSNYNSNQKFWKRSW